jgi:hypothetical protein
MRFWRKTGPWALSSFLCIFLLVDATATGAPPDVPETLKPWEGWVTWGVEHRDCPTLYSSAHEPICFWPSRLELSASEEGGTWNTSVRVFEESWVELPGSSDLWPMNVRVGEEPAVVVGREGHPAVKLPAGQQQLSGEFRWDQMPQRIAIPKAIGILSLEVNGNPVPVPSWDPSGEVWLKRARSAAADKDLLNLQVYRVIEDGIPVWLRTEIEVTVSGKSREEELGWILPLGWQISTVDSPLPVAVDDRGLIRAQVRAGKWTIAVHAFRTTDPNEIRFAPEATPVTATELVALKTNPSFRISQLTDLSTVDVTQTTFPAKWRNLPVFQWNTGESFRLVEKMRGLGEQSPESLSIDRRMWLDEDGDWLTYQDRLRGKMQQLWRLDVADGQELGAVREGGQGQLITANPQTGASGVEIRSRDLDMEAIGRLQRTDKMPAVGWQTDVDSMQLTLTLPPGWRVFAMLGAEADQIEGDWLTAWTLLDLFLLLIFSLAVYRLYGVVAGIVALLAFGLSYHEPDAPRYLWLLLLMPLALLRVVGEGAGKRWIMAWKYIAIGLLLISLIPFAVMQTQSAIYPQLDTTGMVYGSRGIFAWPGSAYIHRARVGAFASLEREPQSREIQRGQAIAQSKFASSNLLYDPKAKIQTGPARPRWTWNNVRCTWNGTVTADQIFRPILISLPQHRVLTIVRLILLTILAGLLIGGRKLRFSRWKRKGAVAAASLMLLIVPGTAAAQMPDRDLLDGLRQRLLETPDAFPNAAELPSVELTIEGGRIEMQTQIHAALDVAVPLPGRLPSWSPVSVTLDSGSDVVVTRRDGFLWLLVPQGVHDVVVNGLLPDETDWEWTFLLKPKYVSINAPGWKVTGVDADGVPDPQVFFVKEQETVADTAAYDRTNFNAVVVIDRYLEVGLESKVHTTVTRLSSPGKAIALQVPLLPQESVLTSSREVSGGNIAVRFGAAQKEFSWDSELPSGSDIQLVAAQSDTWVERWHLITSPVWNVAIAGELNPVFEADQKDLIPVWHPWPGEQAALTFSKPVPVIGDIMTVQNVDYEATIRSRQRTSKLMLDLEASVPGDFVIEIDLDAKITALNVDQQSIPVQRDGAKLIVPSHPGRQAVNVEWKTDRPMETVVGSGDVKLPVDASNIKTVMKMPENRWILWADGPLRGPAVRFWTILVVAILVALALGSVPRTPLRRWEWVLLAIGLTQVHLIAAMLVVGWLFMLAYRGSEVVAEEKVWSFNFGQVAIILMTFVALIILVIVVGQGLLGHPDMFIIGNGSTRTYLQWFQPRSGPDLPTPFVVSISVWFYRLLMLFWALWLAMSLLRWLTWGWKQFSHGGTWRSRPLTATLVSQQADPEATGS